MKKDTRAVFGLAIVAVVFLMGTLLLLGGAKDHFRRKEIENFKIRLEICSEFV